MPIGLAVWRIDVGAAMPLQPASLTDERELETMLQADISMLGLPAELMVIGRQVPTDFGGRIDLLCIDATGALWVVEVKKERTPREVVAQALDYGYWVAGLGRERVIDIARMSDRVALEDAFAERFAAVLPETVNTDHHLVIVAGRLDDATERIVRYCQERGLDLNVVLFQTFRDGEHRYLTRSWLTDPVQVELGSRQSSGRKQAAWNGEDFYVNVQEFEDRAWEDLRRYGYVSAGGGPAYSGPLRRLTPGSRVFAYVPGHGYTGVGRVTSDGPVPLEAFTVRQAGRELPILQADLETPNISKYAGDAVLVEHFVRVDWEATVGLAEAIRERPPLYSNPLVVTKLTDRRTRRTVLARLGLDDENPDA